ncbi:MAG: TVP38/TMEM64 family protein [Gemmatimonadales bacterium]|jgi:uncharacterized membrane protein YdjX (TVP38/TMEM64 family)|nr:TVP38/TMEM64 family protein [Gemmatimonadales bacterium]
MSRRSTALRLALGAGVLVVLALGGRQVASLVPAFAEWVRGLGAWGPVAFIAGYALATVAFVPGSLLTLAAGAIFGLGPGIAYVLLAATLGATAAFLVARHLARDAVTRRLATQPRFAAVDRAIAREGRRIVLLLRLSPVVPFNLLNYALGLTSVRLRDFVLASIGMLPGTALYVYVGKLAGDLATLAAGQARPHGPAYYAVLALGLAATVLVTVLVTRTARRALDAATGATAP